MAQKNDEIATKGNYDPCPQGWKIPHRGNAYQVSYGQGFKFMETGATDYVSADQKTFQTVPSTKFNNRFIGHYITYDGTNIDFWPGGGNLSNGYIVFNASGNIGYYWAAQYYDQNPAYTSAGVKLIFNSSKNNSVDYNWGQTSSGYQIRCMKGTN